MRGTIVDLPERSGDSEVTKENGAVVVDQKIRRFYVTVNEAIDV